MGYDVHIARSADWADSESVPITLAEWLAVVTTDDSLEADSANGPNDFLFVGHSKEPWPLWWWRGEVYTKDPDSETIRKMVQVARRLGATVQGDDGEHYDETGEPDD